jgi:hypothetical protein
VIRRVPNRLLADAGCGAAGARRRPGHGRELRAAVARRARPVDPGICGRWAKNCLTVEIGWSAPADGRWRVVQRHAPDGQPARTRVALNGGAPTRRAAGRLPTIGAGLAARKLVP